MIHTPLQHIRTTARRFIFAGLALLVIVGTPVPVYVHADESACSPVAAAPTGIQQPTGADAGTYTYNSCTGLWENPHYTWNPSTKVKTPVPWPTYTYNQTTGKWDAQQWVYSPAKAAWYQQAVSVATPPADAPTVGGPPPAVPASQPFPGGSSGTAPAPTVTTTDTTSATDSANTSVSLNNTVGSTAQTGDAAVLGNTQAGNATSGNATAVANVVNSVQTTSALGDGTVTFVANIDGDVQGDLLIDPSALQPASGPNSLANTNNLTLNTTTDAAINNNISLAAQSGNATVAQNTQAGNATSGNATAVVNVVNMINSLISAKQSFVGVININGNLTGNILVPQSFVDSLMASNTPRQTVAVSNNTLAKLTANTTTDQSITNNVHSSAQSGNASVTENTQAGNATSGTASTNVTIFDLTNSQVTAKNTLLVFVNVTGKWIGLIMDAPAGTTAAELGGGVTTNTSSVVDASAATTQSITNNIGVSAQSGDATVAQNTQAGNATSGNASTSVNLLNVTSSNFDLTNWFGILFINVFGNWFGSFGVAKPPITTIPKSGTTARMPSRSQTFSFVPYTPSAGGGNTQASSDTGSSAGGAGDSSVTTHSTPAITQAARRVLGATVAAPVDHRQPATASGSLQAALLGLGLFGAGLAYGISDRVRATRSSRR